MYADVIEYTEDLTDTQMGQLYRAQIQYANGIEPVITDPEVKGIWRVVKHQMDVNSNKYADKCEKMRANASKRKQLQANATKSIQIESDTDTDNDTDIKERVSKDTPKKAHPRFAPPTVAEVAEYCRERQNTVDPQTFVDFYASKGWMVGKNPMKDWKACVRTWERDRVGPARNPKPPDHQGISREEDLDGMMMQRMFGGRV
jgi:hypothetical protein